MRQLLLTILAGMLYFAGVAMSWAQNVPMDYSYPDEVHMQVVNEELDKMESYRQNQVALLNSAVVARRNEIDFSSEIYSAKFDEPKNLSQKGFLQGYNAQYAHRFSTDPKSMVNMYSLQAQWADGKFKQPPYEGPSGIKDSTYDLRGVVGKDFYPASNVRTTAYAGYGYRYLEDDSQGLNTVVDGYTLLGYKRYSHYNYLPLGADFVYQPDRNYSLESNLEYDYMFYGWESDKIGVVPGFNTLDVDQKDGSGLRASLRLNLYFKDFSAFAEVFYRFWSIPESTSKVDNSVSLNEPKNNTEEFGLRLGLQI